MARQSVLVFAGSARTDSLNRKLARAAARAAKELGAKVTHIELRDYPLPIYDGDHEALLGTPRHVLSLRALLKRHSIWLIASPDYNCSISPLLKNVIDWVSRPLHGEDYLACFKDRHVGIMSSSPGSSGGARGLPHLRHVLTHLGARVLGEQLTVPRGATAFDGAGGLVDAEQRHKLRAFIQSALDAAASAHAEVPEFHAA